MRRLIGTLMLVLAVVCAPVEIRGENIEDLDEADYQPRGSRPFDDAVLRFLRKEKPKIIGGAPAADGAYPWQVSLSNSWQPDVVWTHYCGGAIIDSHWILTAAHCLVHPASDIVIRGGTNRLASGAESFTVSKLIKHKAYRTVAGVEYNDIALIRTQKPLPLGDKMKPIKVATGNSESPILVPKAKLVVTGWGATQVNGVNVRELQFVEVEFVERKPCNHPLSHANKVTEEMICAGSSKGGMDSCQGDSGGPLFQYSETPTLVGIVSWGGSCGEALSYGVYTRVAKFSNWISQCISSPDTCNK